MTADDDKKARRREYNARYYVANRERAIKAALEWKKANPERVRITNARSRAATAEKIAAKAVLYRENNRERVRVYQSKYEIVHKDRLKARRASHYLANKARISERHARNYQDNAEHLSAKGKAYWKANPDKRLAYKANRRAREQGAIGRHTAEDIRALFVMQRYKCANCRASVKEAFHIDHKVPLARGGSNDRHNLEVLCPKCNRRKSARDPIEFARLNGRLL